MALAALVEWDVLHRYRRQSVNGLVGRKQIRIARRRIGVQQPTMSFTYDLPLPKLDGIAARLEKWMVIKV